MLDHPELLSVAQTAARLNVSKHTVKRLIADGELAGGKLGGSTNSHYRITVESVDSLIASLTPTAKET